MRILELRRHSVRTRPDEHLSQEGVSLARRVGDHIAPFDLAVSSPSPRAYETAIAMGFAVDEFYEPVQFDDPEWRELDALMPEGTPFAARARAMKMSSLAARYTTALLRQWTAIVERLPQGGRALVISHGGYLEDSAVACLPDENHREWGGNFGHCEGIRLTFERGKFTEGEILRVG